jgi:hypothetical protein
MPGTLNTGHGRDRLQSLHTRLPVADVASRLVVSPSIDGRVKRRHRNLSFTGQDLKRPLDQLEQSFGRGCSESALAPDNIAEIGDNRLPLSHLLLDIGAGCDIAHMKVQTPRSTFALSIRLGTASQRNAARCLP